MNEPVHPDEFGYPEELQRIEAPSRRAVIILAVLAWIVPIAAVIGLAVVL